VFLPVVYICRPWLLVPPLSRKTTSGSTEVWNRCISKLDWLRYVTFLVISQTLVASTSFASLSIRWPRINAGYVPNDGTCSSRIRTQPWILPLKVSGQSTTLLFSYLEISIIMRPLFLDKHPKTRFASQFLAKIISLDRSVLQCTLPSINLMKTHQLYNRLTGTANIP